MVLGSEVSEKWLGLEGEAPMNRITALIKEIPERSWTLPAYEDTEESWHSVAHNFLTSPNQAGTLMWDFQPPELWEIYFCCL